MSWPRRSLIVAVVAFASAALAPVAADAAPALSPPVSIDSTIDRSFDVPSTTALAVGVSDGGDAIAAWRGGGSVTGAVKLALWSASASAPVVVDGGLGSDPDVAMAPDGHALAAWTGSDGRLRVTTRQPRGGFAAATAIDRPGDFDPGIWGTPSVALRTDGSGLVAVPTCLVIGSYSDQVLRVFEVTSGGTVLTSDQQPDSHWSGNGGCPAQVGVARAAAGEGGRASATLCLPGSDVCFLAIRNRADAPWTVDGIDGTPYGSGSDAAAPVVTAGGATIVVWRVGARLLTAVGSDAGAMNMGVTVADALGGIAAPALVPLGGDALLLSQLRLGDGSQQAIERPLFATGSLGDLAEVGAPSYQPSAPYADPHAATWPDGSGLIALAAQTSARATPSLSLQQRSLGGTLTPVEAGAQTRAVTLPRVAVAGTAAQPLALVATREAPASGPATIVLRRLDGAPPRLTLTVPPTATAGRPVQLRANVSDMSGPVTVGWSFGDGGTAQGAEVDHTFATPGARTVVVTATDAVGNASGASATIDVVAAPPGGGGGGDRTAPALAGVRLSATRFRAGRGNTALSARASSARAAAPAPPSARAAARRRRRTSTPSGTTIRLSSSEAATVKIAVVRVRSGRKQRGKCRAGARRGRRCTLRTTVKTFARGVRGGASSIPFSARFGGRALPAGSYELQLVATDAAGNRGRARTVKFTLVR
ncbi:PKD domain-containing protein [Conexibacter sp. JD483]|uniref:PKD domain-containing protein n=1 Tax=unclassified Conexibacter TaxID=2627773 RepID=UPI0027176431|nr:MULTISPECIES: PKD domain-containing protein [unclassified Conexibacter]MDO8185659.1 PKD domain-containing protein [Conexibacter sp. CPCC 205706]MDO8198832.1 PKD domain-containing protein [Conexibacter sp. CPCC 205762]MDR9367818.1 PKD domain-containing protein [Conexibacter sp. JD483]